VDRKYRIIIAEDHTILREGLHSLISSETDFEVIGEAENGREAIRLAQKQVPDLILMDLSMPKMNGMDAIREIKKNHPHILIVALTVHKTEEYILATLQAGANGYVLKDATHAELMMALKSVLDGKTYLSPGVSEKVIDGYLEGRKHLKTQSSWDTLSAREREILKLIAEGHKNREIAQDLFLSLKTVEKHRSNLMKKLDLHNAAALTAFAIEKGLVEK